MALNTVTYKLPGVRASPSAAGKPSERKAKQRTRMRGSVEGGGEAGEVLFGALAEGEGVVLQVAMG